jgi:hypothetical protein
LQGFFARSQFVRHVRGSPERARLLSLRQNMWREAPGFFQRSTATFGDGGTTITGCGREVARGSSWEHDFELIYTKVRQAP